MSNRINFYKQLKADPSRANIDFVTYIIGNDKNAFTEVFELVYTAPHPINQRAAGVIETSSRKYPELLSPILDYMIETFNDFEIDGVRRNFMKMFIRTKFNDDQSAKIISICFNCMADSKESIAVRVYSMNTIYNISNSIPEIKNELILTIENGMHLGNPAWIARGRNLLKKLYKEVDGVQKV